MPANSTLNPWNGLLCMPVMNPSTAWLAKTQASKALLQFRCGLNGHENRLDGAKQNVPTKVTGTFNSMQVENHIKASSFS